MSDVQDQFREQEDAVIGWLAELAQRCMMMGDGRQTPEQCAAEFRVFCETKIRQFAAQQRLAAKKEKPQDRMDTRVMDGPPAHE